MKRSPEERAQAREVAYTSLGRNALFIGLVTHVAALFLAMTPDFGVRFYFYSLYIFCWALLIVGLYAEMNDREYRPSGDYRFYLLSLSAIFPIVGPLISLVALYLLTGVGKKASFSFFGMIGSFLRLRASSIVIVLFLLILSALFVFIYSTHDPYFKRARGKRVSSLGRIDGFRTDRKPGSGRDPEGAFLVIGTEGAGTPAIWSVFLDMHPINEQNPNQTLSSLLP